MTSLSVPPYNRRRDGEKLALLQESNKQKDEEPPTNHRASISSPKKALKSVFWRRVFSIRLVVVGFSCLILGLFLGRIDVQGHGDDCVTTPENGTSVSEDSPLLVSDSVAPLTLTKPFRPNGFCFVHISKCAGASWIELLKDLLPDFHPEHSNGDEFSLKYSQEEWPDTQMLTSIKSPRRHIWSLFTECKYDAWGRRQVNGTKFPNAGDGKHTDGEPSEETDDNDFLHWMRHFFHVDRPEVPRMVDWFRCYHPSNYQSRHFVTPLKHPHGTGKGGVGAVPTIEDVLEKYRNEVAWVGITEFFHESKCLLYWRYTKGTLQETMSAYLEDHCRCGDDDFGNDGPTHDEVIVTHHAEGHREHFYDMPEPTLKMMDALSTTDRALYQQALVDFIGNVMEMESDLGRKVLCKHATEKYEAELEYLLVDTPTRNVTKLVELMRQT